VLVSTQAWTWISSEKRLRGVRSVENFNASVDKVQDFSTSAEKVS